MSNSNQGTPKKSAKEPAIENTSTADSGATVQHASEEIAESVMCALPTFNRNVVKYFIFMVCMGYELLCPIWTFYI